MSSPSDPQAPVDSAGATTTASLPSARLGATQEVPFVPPAGATKQLPPHPGAVAPAPVSPEPVQATGPVDFVPGLPGLGTPPVPQSAAAAPPPPVQPVPTEVPVVSGAPVWPDTLEAEAASGRPEKRRHKGTARDRAAVLGLGLAVLALALLELGLALDFGTTSYWSAVPLWSAFATLCAALGVLAFIAAFPAGSKIRSGALWRIAAAGLVGLAVFWLLVVLPVVASDRGFLLTAALGALGCALWIGPGRKG